MNKDKTKKSIAPALVLMAFAPLIAEVLPGATRFSSLFVFPVEMCVWGGGALLIRYAVRRWNLGWLNMLLLALALSVAEEFLIQQTSVAPMVIKIKGITYARALGVNYVYLLWALIYEPVFVVFLPVYLVEMIFPGRRRDLWINKTGVITVAVLFLAGCFLAWYSWTQIARPQVFHVPEFKPPFIIVLIAVVATGCLIFTGVGPFKNKITPAAAPLNPPPPQALAVIAGLWAVFLYGVVVLAFGLLPSFPPLIAMGTGFLLAAAAFYLIPGWAAHARWNTQHRFSVIFGTITGAMAAGFIGFIGAAPRDLYFKMAADIIAVLLMGMFGLRLLRVRGQAAKPAP